jgi:hypothetical protein
MSGARSKKGSLACGRAVQVGDVWWLDDAHVNFPGGKDRYCLVVALETPPGGTAPTRAHFIVGSSSPGGPPVVVIERGESGFRRRTFFRFWWSGSVELANLISAGKFKAKLSASRILEIEPAIRASKLLVLKRLLQK